VCANRLRDHSVVLDQQHRWHPEIRLRPSPWHWGYAMVTVW
jgi:hypothetical protein